MTLADNALAATTTRKGVKFTDLSTLWTSNAVLPDQLASIAFMTPDLSLQTTKKALSGTQETPNNHSKSKIMSLCGTEMTLFPNKAGTQDT